MIQALPFSKESMAQLGEDTGSKIHARMANIRTEELPTQRWGLGIQPFFMVSDFRLDEAGDIDVSEVRWPVSAEVKMAPVRGHTQLARQGHQLGGQLEEQEVDEEDSRGAVDQPSAGG